MKNSRKIFKKMLAIISATCLTALICIMNPELANAASSSGTWSVHVQSGSYQQKDVVALYNYGNGYVATCTAISGDCSTIKTTITEYTNSLCTAQVTLNKTVAFTRQTSITFNAASMPTTSVVYMKAQLTYGGGSTAAMSGTVGINN